MSLRNAVLFEAGRPTMIFRAQWTQKGASQPLPAGFSLLQDDLTPTRLLSALWTKAFPTRPPLTTEPIAKPDGTGTEAFWTDFA
jgi:hypothetical protein